MVEAKPLTFWTKDRIGVLKVTSFPGAIGFDLLRDLKNALAAFEEKRCDRLVLDLRLNCGGGLSSVRLMSLLVPDRRLIGYSLTRLGRDRKQASDALPAIRRLPDSKLGALPLAFRFKFVNRDRSFRIFTEGLGTMPFDGRVTVLVNEYTRSAAEMVVAFARNEAVARVIGTRTPGEVLGAANFHVGSDYRRRMPVTAWYTADGKLIEGEGVPPDLSRRRQLTVLSPEEIWPCSPRFPHFNEFRVSIPRGTTGTLYLNTTAFVSTYPAKRCSWHSAISMQKETIETNSKSKSLEHAYGVSAVLSSLGNRIRTSRFKRFEGLPKCAKPKKDFPRSLSSMPPLWRQRESGYSRAEG